ncbi:hypothetical protein [Chitinophaga sp. CF418]|uniref:hypothetical protein n=1 Tax=Chitinophaga sp. CF418 TaxID=1855287 RepID=UPI00091CEB2E|nr:hypothetical protein [Chitinophaga sp. CF418]SHM46712.1 hypothetical protein SAMN05216311_102254 [Chitinophaga sp. CF418]
MECPRVVEAIKEEGPKRLDLPIWEGSGLYTYSLAWWNSYPIQHDYPLNSAAISKDDPLLFANCD